MTLINGIITGALAIMGVFLGGVLAIRNQDRLWLREHDRQWRDIRLQTYGDFASAYRAMVAYIGSPGAQITSSPHPRRQNESIAYFDEVGRTVREQMEASMTRVRLVSLSAETAAAAHGVVFAIRDLASARAEHAHDAMPDRLYVKFFICQQKFLTAARAEVGLPELPDTGRPDSRARK